MPEDYVQAIGQIQRFLRRKIAEMHIMIETNPSLNHLIGEYKHYDNHPPVWLYNVGLALEPDELRGSEQIHISIGTDDQGVFATNLENKYSLMALSMEKYKDGGRQLRYNHTCTCDWLHRIARMGHEHRFLQNKAR